ncbi:hypothetical protein ACFVWC_16515 [Bacillus mycoides]|uniref:hypothetical protein n=1 Tax=Bacillus mycoides TaxID=1405 RepID=UPI0036ED31A4
MKTVKELNASLQAWLKDKYFVWKFKRWIKKEKRIFKRSNKTNEHKELGLMRKVKMNLFVKVVRGQNLFKWRDNK